MQWQHVSVVDDQKEERSMRKLLLIGAMGALLALLVSACGGSSGGGGSISVAKEGEGKPTAAGEVCEEEPVAGGNLGLLFPKGVTDECP